MFVRLPAGSSAAWVLRASPILRWAIFWSLIEKRRCKLSCPGEVGDMGTRRIERVNELIREEISELIRREVKDPRLDSFISVTEVVTSPDLRHARVFVSIMGTDEEKQQGEKGLAAAAGFLRRELGERLTLRYHRELSFQLDDSIERGSRLLQLINEVAPGESPEETD